MATAKGPTLTVSVKVFRSPRLPHLQTHLPSTDQRTICRGTAASLQPLHPPTLPALRPALKEAALKEAALKEATLKEAASWEAALKEVASWEATLKEVASGALSGCGNCEYKH